MLRLAEVPSLAAVLLLLLEVGSAQAQVIPASSAPSPAPDHTGTVLPERPLFRGGVELVSLDVCVRSRDGRLVSGLKPEDFLILEDNVPQRLTLFSAAGPVRLAVNVKEVVHARQPLGNASRASADRDSHGGVGGYRSGGTAVTPPSSGPSW